MLKLDQTTRKLQAVLSGAVTTNQLPCMVSYSDDNGTTYVGGTQLTNTNSTTAVDICAAPGASTVRDIDYLSIRNRDTAAATVTVMLDDNGTDYEIVKATLAVGDQLVYVHGSGWNTLDSAGQVKSSATGGGVSDGDKGDITVSSSGTVWSVDSAAITLAKMANLAQDQFIGRTTASTGVPETATITAAARTVLDDASTGAIINTLGTFRKNPLINADFRINQRAAATNADDTYSHDRWYVLTQTGTIAVTTLTDVENTTPRMARLTQSQASAQRMGYAQIIEGINCKHLRGQQVTFRFGRTRLSSTANVRYAVLEWTGTEDTVTSDVVNDWTSGTYTAGNFFIAANLTVSGTTQQALTANTLTDGSTVTVTLGSSFNNLIVFAWTESTVAQNVTFDLGKAQIERGDSASIFETNSYGSELILCSRYFQLAPCNAAGGIVGYGTKQGTQYIIVYSPWQVTMRAACTWENQPTSWVAGAPTTGQMAAYDYTTAAYITISGALTVIPPASSIAGQFTFLAGTSFSGTAGAVVGPLFGDIPKISAEL